ncbi:MAG TPA: 3'-5' exonuclease [Elusimicrobiales bacterium]|nr:3'-5' exonuclease [Elusimicrobiales bacterium]
MNGNIALLSGSIEETVFSVLDLETTGMSPAGGGRVCEVAVVRMQAGEVLDIFCELLNPGCTMPPEVTRIHGITDQMVRGKPRFAEVAPRLLSFLDGTALVCHNCPFDIPFLKSEFEREGLNLPELPALDTLRLARLHGSFPSNSLGNIVRELGFSNEGWHRAEADARMTGKLLGYFTELLRKKGARTLEDLLRLQESKILRRK